MDVQMPGMDGITATQHIRALDHPSRSVPIVAMTANVLPAQIAAFRAAGMDEHVGKPFKRLDLLAVIEKVVAGAKPSPASAIAAGDDPGFDRDVHDRIVDMLGPQQMASLLHVLAELLNDRFTEERLVAADGLGLAANAHSIVSLVGMLGFMRLSRTCAELEEGCLGGADPTAILAEVVEARRATLRLIGEMQSAEDGTRQA